jgi:hypothetical protein
MRKGSANFWWRETTCKLRRRDSWKSR